MEASERSEQLPGQWQELEAGCADAIRLSQVIATRLRQGATAGEFVPLLHQQRDLVQQLQTRIHDLGRQPRHPQDSTCRDHLVRQLHLLLDLEQGNHQLLARRGFRLRGPQFGRR